MKNNAGLIRWMSILMMVLLVVFAAGCGKKEAPDTPEETPVVGEEKENPGNEPGNTPGEEAPGEGDTLSQEELKDLFGSGRALAEIFYEMKVTGVGNEDVLSRIYMKNGQMRAESESMGQTFAMIQAEDAMYMLDGSSKTAMKIPLGGNSPISQDPVTIDDFTKDVDDLSMRYLGKETVNGIVCHVVETVDQDGEHQVKMWLHEDYGFPLRVESQAKDGSEAVLMEVTDFKVGGLSDDLFKVPEDYEIVDMGNMIPTAP